MKNIIIAIDAPDPDNFVLVKAINYLFPDAQIYILLTGRPVNSKGENQSQIWDYDIESSFLSQKISASRLNNFLKNMDMSSINVYDGGIAPRTLVPHHLHFKDYYQFLDVDPLDAIRNNQLKSQEDLISILLKVDDFAIVVGGPMTGLSNLLIRCPQLIDKISEIHAMYATWGTVQLMQMDDKPRGALQFNVACDPFAANFILKGVKCPIYILPSEVTRVSEIGFQNVIELQNALPKNNKSKKIIELYEIWYKEAIQPRQMKNSEEKIFIHDLVSAFSLNKKIRNAMYQIVPIEITEIPYLPNQFHDWGKILMRETDKLTNHFAAKKLKDPFLYLTMLRDIFI